MTRPLRIAGALALAAWVIPALAQERPAADEQARRVIVRGESRTLLGRFEAAARHAGREAWSEALDEYQRLLDDFGDELTPVETPRDRAGSTRRSVQVRRLCHLRIAALPPTALRLYRTRTDARAKQWLAEGAERRDPAPLRRVVEQAFCSRPAEQALLLLGDLAFERGRFAEARSWYRLLALPPTAARAPVPPGRGLLLYTDPTGDLAGVRARQVLAQLFEGDLAGFDVELAGLRSLHPAAAGHLAGRKGVYVETLAAVRRERGDNPLSADEDDWPTFGGDPSRQRVLSRTPPERLWAEGPAWRVELRPGEREADRRSAPSRRLAFAPILVGTQVLIADARHVSGYEMRDGRRAWDYDLTADVGERPLSGLDLRLPAARELRYTLTAADGRAYARMGGFWLGPPARVEAADGDAPSCLVCLDLPAKPGAKARWVARAGGAKDERAWFEGAPLVCDGKVYGTITRLVGSRSVTTLVALNADTGAAVWKREVCEAPEFEGHGPRCRHHLVTLAGNVLVYCNHAGAVVAADARTGKLLWAVRYPSRGPDRNNDEPSPRDLAPCVAVGHRLFVAPLDSDRILCLDVETGRLCWEREGVEAVHLLGVAAGRLILTTPDGIRAVRADSGSDDGGWRQPSAGRLAGYGRGLLAADRVFWPTQGRRLSVRSLLLKNGEPAGGDPSRLHRLAPGNYAFGRSGLVVADTTELIGYPAR